LVIKDDDMIFIINYGIWKKLVIHDDDIIFIINYGIWKKFHIWHGNQISYSPDNDLKVF